VPCGAARRVCNRAARHQDGMTGGFRADHRASAEGGCVLWGGWVRWAKLVIVSRSGR
jgi:hypothetical protein